MENSIRVLKEWNEERSKDAMERYYCEKMCENWEKGLHKGQKNGIKIGKKEACKIAAIKMLEDDVELSDIAKYTGLSIQKIQALKTN